MFYLQAKVENVLQNPATDFDGKKQDAHNLIQVMAWKTTAGGRKLITFDLKAPIGWGILDHMVGKTFMFPVNVSTFNNRVFANISCSDMGMVQELKDKQLKAV